MEAKNHGYSLKNKPMPTKQHHKFMIDKGESFITRLKTHFMIWCNQSNLNQSEIIFNPC